MELAYLAFSETGYELAGRLSKALGGKAYRSGVAGKDGTAVNLKSWTAEHFKTCDAIVFVGAIGIAVRAIAPHVKSKDSDPAVIVIDERALHVIPILSGHLGGANDLARKIAQITGSDPVITTATDINGVFAVDEWSRRQNCALLEPKKIVGVSGKLLNGAKASVFSAWPVSGEIPDGLRMTDFPLTADIVIDIRRHLSGDTDYLAGDTDKSPGALHLVPRICTLGVGCRKGTLSGTIETQFESFIKEAGIYPEAINQVATIDLKKDEAGLIEFCSSHGWPLITYSSDDLKKAEGEFTASEFVSSVTGVDNVCERSAVLASGGKLIKAKTSGEGVTMALAAAEYDPDWTWTIEE